MSTILLLIGSNIFMTFAWYGHLKFKEVPLWKVILVSWGIALFEYCLQVPANRIGARTFSPDQLKVIQEIITLSVFGVFSVYLLRRQAPLEPRRSLLLPHRRSLLHVPQVLKQQCSTFRASHHLHPKVSLPVQPTPRRCIHLPQLCRQTPADIIIFGHSNEPHSLAD